MLKSLKIFAAFLASDFKLAAGIIAKAKGLAIITVFKAGFLVTARGGSGIVIAKLSEDGEGDYTKGWSAPSAIAMAGLGGGFEIGLEVTDFVIILNTKSAVDAFSKGGNLTLGGNFTIAAGPLGRNIEGDVAVRSPAAIYTYSKTKGLFAGISVEGSALIERKDANKKFYGREIRAHQILNGEVGAPEECQALYDVLQEHKEFAAQALLKMGRTQSIKFANRFEEAASSQSHKSSVLVWNHLVTIISFAINILMLVTWEAKGSLETPDIMVNTTGIPPILR
uniref:Ysc84 actin-binding domain-containing protein n=1 Tax=Biomphalaria glabrata TaxID=6526 RepID=A0A2C9K6X8_BIOGL